MTDMKSLLLAVRDGLAPLVEEVLKKEADASGENWIEVENVRRIEKNLRPLRVSSQGSVIWDPSDLLQTIKGERWYSLRSIFAPKKEKLSAKEERDAYNLGRGRIDEILKGRNDWAHFNKEETSHTAHTCALLLSSVGLTELARSLETHLQRDALGGEPIILKAESSGAIRLVREDFRGLDLEQHSTVERVSPGERIRIEIDLSKVKADQLQYGLVLVVDPAEVFCLLPSERIAPNRRLQRPTTFIPDPNTTRLALRFKGTIGRHIILTVCSRGAFPESIYAALNSPQPRSYINRIWEIIHELQSIDFLLLKLEFDVG